MQLSGQNNASWTNSFQLLDTTAPLQDAVKIDEGQKTLECEKPIENRSQIEAIDGLFLMTLDQSIWEARLFIYTTTSFMQVAQMS